MDSKLSWTQVREHFRKCQKLNFHHAIASVDNQGYPRITPIGSIFLNDDYKGFYFEVYCSTLRKNVTTNPRVAFLAVNSGKIYWFKSLLKGVFKGPPAVKLYGQLGIRRLATDLEIKRLQRRLGLARKLKGYDLLWSDMNYIREFSIDKTELVEFGSKMPVAI